MQIREEIDRLRAKALRAADGGVDPTSTGLRNRYVDPPCVAMHEMTVTATFTPYFPRHCRCCGGAAFSSVFFVSFLWSFPSPRFQNLHRQEQKNDRRRDEKTRLPISITPG